MRAVASVTASASNVLTIPDPKRRAGATFAMAAEEWLRFIEFDRQRKRSTVRGYRSIVRAHLLPAFGERPLEAIDARGVERWRSNVAADRRLANATINQLLMALHGMEGPRRGTRVV